ncbi:hypothetical protein BAY59_10950 [Prauserella coralliicola]|nr:hypothetical protein BAY59_10950 [Prauserella coralliicola]
MNPLVWVLIALCVVVVIALALAGSAFYIALTTIRDQDRTTNQCRRTVAAFDSVARQLGATPLFTHVGESTGRHALRNGHSNDGDRTRLVWPPESDLELTAPYALNEE